MNIVNMSAIACVKKVRKTRPVGCFHIDFEEAREFPEFYAEVLADMRFFPLRVEVQADLMVFSYTGYSHLFEEISEGAKIPFYDIKIRLDTDAMAAAGDMDTPVLKSFEVTQAED